MACTCVLHPISSLLLVEISKIATRWVIVPQEWTKYVKAAKYLPSLGRYYLVGFQCGGCAFLDAVSQGFWVPCYSDSWQAQSHLKLFFLSEGWLESRAWLIPVRYTCWLAGRCWEGWLVWCFGDLKSRSCSAEPFLSEDAGQSRSGQPGSALSLVLFCSAVQWRKETSIKGWWPLDYTVPVVSCGFVHSEAPLNLCLHGRVFSIIEDFTGSSFYWAQITCNPAPVGRMVLFSSIKSSL